MNGSSLRAVAARVAVALAVLWTGMSMPAPLHAQVTPPAALPTPAAPTPCPTAAQTSHIHLYGLWRAEFSGGVPGATLLLEKHPEYAEGVRGVINRDGAKGWVAGDVDDGEFSLDESDDGIKIAANWAGTVLENSCGKEIRGTWTSDTGQPAQAFVLRKVPGWE